MKATWDALCEGKYDWAHLAMHLWPERVVPKCATDRSLAIAHGLEDVFWVEGDDGKWKPRANADAPDQRTRRRAVLAGREGGAEEPPGSAGPDRAGQTRAEVQGRLRTTSMHPLHDYIARQISDRLKDHRIVVMYDPRKELPTFFEEACGGAGAAALMRTGTFGGRKADRLLVPGLVP